MKWNEDAYRELVIDVLVEGKRKSNRNGDTIVVPGGQIKLDVYNNKLPLITGRKMFIKGIIGEAITLLQAKSNIIHVSEFEKNGCNYWNLWADKEGYLNIDYPVYKHFNRIIKDIKKDPYSRRHIVDLWDQDNIENLSLPCCHYSYQFIVVGEEIHMIWNQRSADLMVGVPSDMILATLYLHTIARETNYIPGTITMNFGDVHIYNEHIENAQLYAGRKTHRLPKLHITDKPFWEWTPANIKIIEYTHEDPIKFILKE